jgi:hypothetical protein
MTPERFDHMMTQYIWALENEQVFVVKAKHEVDRGNFSQFRRLLGSAIMPTRGMLGEAKSYSLAPAEWSFMYIEMWHRLGGNRSSFTTSNDEAEYNYQLNRLLDHDYTLTFRGVAPKRFSSNPCAEILISQPQPCVLAEPEKEIPVSKKIIIANVTFINNVDVTTMKEDQLIDAIKTIEAEIADLKAVKTKSAKIAAKIAEAQETLTKVVEILDSRP